MIKNSQLRVRLFGNTVLGIRYNVLAKVEGALLCVTFFLMRSLLCIEFLISEITKYAKFRIQIQKCPILDIF